ncbi:MAG: hypothetical protein A2527_12850 [Candidatus Lambdaproteobacteria bacterium RIFOXYD2_FULL_50_16]|uniref:Uncharacterized protein n=1 Tax=Candidatus Lambdaproteobacteria bacterium RIFOXYD2_FULL_50_16 TaxID=1817772 RepID=A0A1F6G9P0_9PROT|nr:MAG: hypothetical protein A2527_12850 [Candidatus Lambdaproteobacteria bacterium RIFOXYD2_FULL_50_16]
MPKGLPLIWDRWALGALIGAFMLAGAAWNQSWRINPENLAFAYSPAGTKNQIFSGEQEDPVVLSLPNGDYSISLWVWPHSLQRPVKHDLANIFWIGDPAGVTEASFWLNTKTQRFHFSAYNSQADLTPQRPILDRPFLVQLVKQGAGFRLFLDMMPVPLNARPAKPAPAVGQFILGEGRNPQTGFSGEIGGVKIWAGAQSRWVMSQTLADPWKLRLVYTKNLIAQGLPWGLKLLWVWLALGLAIYFRRSWKLDEAFDLWLAQPIQTRLVSFTALALGFWGFF